MDRHRLLIRVLILPQNPQRRDVQMLNPQSYIVIQWVQDNPGVWPLHCHFAFHSALGLVVNVVELQDKLVQTLTGVGPTLGSTCQTWGAWTKKNGKMMTDIDSGL